MAVLALVAGSAKAQWSDDFESYPDGTQSILVGPGADTVHEFEGQTFGKWLLRCQVYVPT